MNPVLSRFYASLHTSFRAAVPHGAMPRALSHKPNSCVHFRPALQSCTAAVAIGSVSAAHTMPSSSSCSAYAAALPRQQPSKVRPQLVSPVPIAAAEVASAHLPALLCLTVWYARRPECRAAYEPLLTRAAPPRGHALHARAVRAGFRNGIAMLRLPTGGPAAHIVALTLTLARGLGAGALANVMFSPHRQRTRANAAHSRSRRSRRSPEFWRGSLHRAA